MQKKTFYYARVSSKDQNEDRQIKSFRELGAEDRDIVIDKSSGKDLDRTGYIALKTHMLRPGDTLIIKELDRLSRDKYHLKAELEYFKINKIKLKVLDIPTTMIDYPEGQEWIMDMVNNILIEVIGSFAEQERISIRRRQREGIDIALAEGRPYGRPKVPKPDNWDEVIEEWQNGKITAVEAMKRTSMTKASFYKKIKSGF